MHDVISPVSELVVATVPSLTADEADAAIARAHAALPAWRDTAPADRAAMLRRFSDIVREHNEELAQLEVLNAGHTISNARWEANNVANVLGYYAGAPERLFGRQIPVPGGINVTFKEPVGVVGVIVPWNFPMPIAGWGFAPALAAGCTVVLKPAELTPLTAIRLGELALEAGIPPDVFIVVPGKGSIVGQRFVDHPLVRKVVFTGSTEVGQRIMAGCAEQVKAVTLELGGKSANVIFADADLEKAAATAPYGVFDNAGQDCCARSRILVQRSVYDRFMELFEPAVMGVKVGDPSLDATEMGPLISKGHHETVASFLDGTARVFQEEIFGPVVSVTTFEDEADAIRLANDSDYGLSGSIWTRDMARGIRVSRGIESGNLSVNSHSSVRYWTPFGGFKKSGLGRELGPDALDAFTETKNVFISTED
jgi:acyl-CoA reductase-like NAD-dependent aldehyde dehydrogenase